MSLRDEEPCGVSRAATPYKSRVTEPGGKAAFPRSGESGANELEYAIFQVRLDPTASGAAA